MELPKDCKLVHVVKSRDIKTICGMILKDILKYKWMHPIEAYKKELTVHNKKDMPTCPDCIKMLQLYKIEIIKEY